MCDGFVLQVDDGFWEGELNGRIGLFPSLVVELVHDEGGEEEEEKEEEEVRPNSPHGFSINPVNHDFSLSHSILNTYNILQLNCF